MNKKIKGYVLIGLLTVSLGVVGCSKNNEETSKEPAKQEQQKEVEKKLTVEDLKKKSDVTFEDLENVAKNQFGKGSAKDGASHYIEYDKEDEKWYFTQDPSKIGEKEENIVNLSKEDADLDLAKTEFLHIYYDEFKKMHDDFLKKDLTKESTYDDFKKESNKWRDLINGSFIEGKSSLYAKTFALVFEGLGNERDTINEIINMSAVIKDKTERESQFEDMNNKRLEKRNGYDDSITTVYNNNLDTLNK